MKKVLVAVFMAVVALGLSAGEAEAARFGGGKSFGMQRQAVTPRPVAPTRQTTAAPATTPKRNWMGPIAGLAAGLGIAALLSHFGMGEGMANLVMIALLAMAAVFVFKLLFRRPGADGRTGDVPGRTAAVRRRQPSAGIPAGAAFGSAASAAPSSEVRVPEGFDTDAFLRVAKLNFVRLQAAMTPRTSTTFANSSARSFTPRSRCKWTNAAVRRNRPIS